MSECLNIDPLVTPYVDGELVPADRKRVDVHLEGCLSCRARVLAERRACALLQSRKAELLRTCAPASLRDRCVASSTAGAVSSRATAGLRAGRSPWARPRLALAAALLLVVGGAIGYRLTLGATEALAAELAVDHVKCFMLNTVLRTHDSLDDVKAALRGGFGWEAALPEAGAATDLSLVGSRPCVYERGKIAHLMYRHRGVPVSVFMLPGTRYSDDLVHTFGHEAVIWTESGRTFVLIARAPRDDVARVAKFVQAALR